MDRDPVDLAFDALIDDRLDVSIVIDCMDERDVETIMAIPWIAVCTDAEGRRPGHPVLDAGRPHPRTYGTPRASSAVRARARDADARDGGRQADVSPGGTRSDLWTGASSARAPSPTSSSSILRPSSTKRPTTDRRSIPDRDRSGGRERHASRSVMASRSGECAGRLLRHG